MFSLPPATTTCASPVRSSWTALLMACNPDPHSRFTLNAVVVSGRPAFSVARRALKASSPTWPTQPRMTSSTTPGEIPARSTAVRIAVAPRSDVGVSLNAPANLPMAVRTPPATTMPPPFSATRSFYVATPGRLDPRARCAPAARPRRSAIRGGAAAAGIAAPLGDLLGLLLGLRNPALDLWPRGIHDALRLVKHRLHLAADLVEALRKVGAHVASGLGCVEQCDGAADDHPVHHASQISHRVLPCGGSPDPTRRFGSPISRVAPILPLPREILIATVSGYAPPRMREHRAAPPGPPGRSQLERARRSRNRSCTGTPLGSEPAGRGHPPRDRRSGWRRCTTTPPARRHEPAATR